MPYLPWRWLGCPRPTIPHGLGCWLVDHYLVNPLFQQGGGQGGSIDSHVRRVQQQLGQGIPSGQTQGPGQLREQARARHVAESIKICDSDNNRRALMSPNAAGCSLWQRVLRICCISRAIHNSCRHRRRTWKHPRVMMTTTAHALSTQVLS